MSTAESTPGTTTTARSRLARLPSLTGLRFYAAALVFFSHVVLPIPTIRLLADDDLAFAMFEIGQPAGGFGVTFFFVLSGFILTWSIRPTDSARAFWRRRAAKIVPSYLVAWVLAMVLVAAATTDLWQAILSFTLLQAWVPDLLINWAVNSPGWSLSVEMLFYLSFPLLYLLARRISAPQLKYWIAGVVAAIAATPLLTEMIIPAGDLLAPGRSTPANYVWFAIHFPPSRLLDFALGVLVARAVLLGRWRNIGMRWSALLLVVSYVVAAYSPILYSWRVICVVPAALLIASAAIADRDGRFTLVRNRATVWLGEISYAFYLVHFTVVQFTRSVLGDRLFSTPVGVLLIFAEFGLSILVSWALYAWVERPFMRRWSAPRRSGTIAVPAGVSAVRS